MSRPWPPCTRQQTHLTKITSTTPTAHKTCTTARLMHDQNKVEACLRPNRLYRYKSRGFPAVRTSTPVSVILKTDQSRWDALDVAHLQQRFFKLSTSLPINGRRCPVIGPMDFVPITPEIYHLRGMSGYIRCLQYVASYGFNCEALRSPFIIKTFFRGN